MTQAAPNLFTLPGFKKRGTSEAAARRMADSGTLPDKVIDRIARDLRRRELSARLQLCGFDPTWPPSDRAYRIGRAEAEEQEDDAPDPFDFFLQ